MSDTDRVKRNIDYLNILCKCNSKMRKSILHNADKDLINTLCECIHNCLNGNIDLNEQTKNKLKRHKNILRKLLVKKKVSIKKKREIFNQKGGFLPVLLSTVLGGLTSILANYAAE